MFVLRTPSYTQYGYTWLVLVADVYTLFAAIIQKLKPWVSSMVP